MPVLDKPLHELKKYMGISPKPVDFDEYWDDRIARLRKVKADYKVSSAPYVMPKGIIAEDLYFTAEDGSEIYAMILRPDDNEIHPVIFEFHGLSGSVGDYSGKVKWASAGGVLVAMDCRGQAGKSSDNLPRKGMNLRGAIVRGVDGGRDSLYYVSIFSDIVQLVELIKTMPYTNVNKMYAHGGSQGGALTVACAALCPDDIKGIMPAYPYLSDYKRCYEMDMIERAYEDIKYYLRSFLPEDGEREAFWNTLGYIDIQNLAPRIKAKVLWYTGLMDNVCPPSTQFAAYNKITSEKEMFIASNYGHEAPRDWWDKEYEFFVKEIQK